MRKTVHYGLRRMKDIWLGNKTDEIQGFADKHDMRNLYHVLHAICGPISSGSFQLPNADG